MVIDYMPLVGKEGQHMMRNNEQTRQFRWIGQEDEEKYEFNAKS